MTEAELFEFDRKIEDNETPPQGWSVVRLEYDNCMRIKTDEYLIRHIDEYIGAMPIESVFMRPLFNEYKVEFYFQDPADAFEFKLKFWL
ncbi:MAG: hypothetical protein EOP83_05070 [Verrucomicrobiaceae bacterium]|nr:MAG: hypothetical protein EOP83_05070 [Verrucomicrobiaceae bacterium]